MVYKLRVYSIIYFILKSTAEYVSSTLTQTFDSSSIPSSTTTTSTPTTTATVQINPIFDIVSNTSLDNIKNILDFLSNGSYDLSGCLVNCSNQGRCMLDPQLQMLLCKCNTYFSGSSCQIDTRPCSSQPCMNNGTCVNEQNGTNEFECQCREGFFNGKYCETPVNLCENRTCSMNGVCTVDNDLARCVCFDGYTGDECQLENLQAKVLRESVKYTSLVVFLTCIITFVTLIVCSDVLSYFGIGDRSKIKLKRQRKTLKTLH